MFEDTEGHETQYCEDCLELQEKLEVKEQECEELQEQLSIAQERYTTMRPHAIELADTKLKLQKEVNTLKQALDEIEKNIKDYCKGMCMAETRETCEICQNTEILNIINKTKEQRTNEN